MKSIIYIKISTLTAILITCFLLVGCFQDVIDIDTSDIGNKIVIEGKITNEARSHLIKIHSTSRYSDPYNFPPVSGAEVSVFVGDGSVIQFQETEPGMYNSTTIEGIPGQTYRLHVIYEDRVYESVSFLPEPVMIDSAKFFPFQDMRRYEFKYYFTDRTDTTIFCRIDPYINNMHLLDEITMFNGKYSDGDSYIRDGIYGDDINSDVVALIVSSMDETSFEIYSRMDKREDYVSDDGDVDAGTLLDMSTFNFSNIDNGAIGLFSAQCITKYEFRYH